MPTSRSIARGERDGEPVGDLVVRSAPLTATMIAGAEIPNVQDEVPALAIAAAFADGVTEIRDAAELAVKESNRIGTLHQELTQLGLAVEPRADGLSIRGGVPRAGAAQEPRRSPHRDGGRDRGERDRRRVDRAGLEGGRVLLSRVRGRSGRAHESMNRAARDVDERAAVARVVAIDGASGSGKSTVARAVADALGLPVLDTGAMYRAVTLAVLETGVATTHEAACLGVAQTVVIELENGKTLLDGRDVSAEIRGPEVTAEVSTVSAHPAVRHLLVEHQREWVRQHGGGVVEGRDIGTVVFPAAPVKVFLVADVEERARRRQRDEHAARPGRRGGRGAGGARPARCVRQQPRGVAAAGG